MGLLRQHEDSRSHHLSNLITYRYTYHISTYHPTISPSDLPTAKPTDSPTTKPTAPPTRNPTNVPTSTPTDHPSAIPTQTPTNFPTGNPSESPSEAPTNVPTKMLTEVQEREVGARHTTMPSTIRTDTHEGNEIQDTIQYTNLLIIVAAVLCVCVIVFGVLNVRRRRHIRKSRDACMSQEEVTRTPNAVGLQSSVGRVQLVNDTYHGSANTQQTAPSVEDLEVMNGVLLSGGNESQFVTASGFDKEEEEQEYDTSDDDDVIADWITPGGPPPVPSPHVAAPPPPPVVDDD
eukprot:1018095_1